MCGDELTRNTTYGRIVGSLESTGRFDISWKDFKTMPFAEQADLVRDVNIIVSAHGAGLTHLLWAQPGTAVVEITPYKPPRDRDDYEHFAADITAHGWPIMHFYWRRKDWISEKATCPLEEAAIAADDMSSAVRERWACFDADALTRLVFTKVVPAVLHHSWGRLGSSDHRDRNKT